ncbi:hypothetical protein TNCV_2394181 [Trichonephila clavipes]|nr:hypothetical protein TNCV_2394181 [Trichonephila clavipes]
MYKYLKISGFVLSAMDFVILNHGQMTWTTPELTTCSPNFHTTPTGGLSSDIFNVHLPYTVGLQWHQTRTHDTLATLPLP